MTMAFNVYQAVRTVEESQDKTKPEKETPELWKVYQWVMELRSGN